MGPGKLAGKDNRRDMSASSIRIYCIFDSRKSGTKIFAHNRHSGQSSGLGQCAILQVFGY